MRDERIERSITEYFRIHTKMTKLAVASAIPKYLKTCSDDVLRYLNAVLQEVPEYEKTENVLKSIILGIELKHCATCGKLMKFSQLKHRFCSSSCIGRNEEMKRKKMETSIRSYGSIEEMHRVSQEHKRKTILEKHGVDHFSKTDKFKQEVRETCLEKLGVDNPMKSEEVREKMKKTMKDRHGSEFISQTKQWREKVRETCLQRHGVESYLQTEECRRANVESLEANRAEIVDKRKKTCLGKYGKESWMQTEEAAEVKAKISEHTKTEEHRRRVIETNLAKYGKAYKSILRSWEHIQSLDYAVPLFTLDEFNGGSEEWHRWRCTKCGCEYESNYADGNVVLKCPRCKLKDGFRSKMELELVGFCKKYFPDLRENDRKLAHACELDIVIPDIKLAIEFNGSYWHSLKVWREKHTEDKWDCYFGKHLEKVLKCNAVGYRLVNVWEDEWTESRDLVKQKLIEIFDGREVIDFSKPLDRSWYNNIESPGYHITEVIEPGLRRRNGLEVEDCGWLVFTRDDAEVVEAGMAHGKVGMDGSGLS